ncbi:DoxX family protein, partial [Rhodococcus hoagii]|nr:DoxX family protein [Prescottella equi]
MIVRRIARPLLSTVFIAGGIDSLRSPAPKAD